MFRKTSETVQLNIFKLPGALFSGNTLEFYEDKRAWHNLFTNTLLCVSMRILLSHYIVICISDQEPDSINVFIHIIT